MQPIAVYDTNILLSGLGWKGIPYRCIELARQFYLGGATLMGWSAIERNFNNLAGER